MDRSGNDKGIAQFGILRDVMKVLRYSIIRRETTLG